MKCVRNETQSYNTQILNNWEETDIFELCTRSLYICMLGIYVLKLGHFATETESVPSQSTLTEFVNLLAVHYMPFAS